MTNDELKTALFSETPVKRGGITYTKVSAIIYRKAKDGVKVEAELYDKCGNSVTITSAESVERVEQ